MTEYMNNTTGEITNNQREAVEWFRSGDNVTAYNPKRPNIKPITWEH